MTKGQKSIFCIDDDRDDLILLRESIQRLSDIYVERAFDGEHALDILLQKKLSKRLPSLIVTDINMPKMDGNSLLRSLKKDEALRNIPVVVFTTSSKTVNQQYIEDHHIQIITKPTDWASYETIAKKLLSYCK